MEISLALPTTLFKDHAIYKQFPTIVVEDPTYFTKFPFHKAKLVLHRASMKAVFARRPHKYIDFYDVDYAQIFRDKSAIHVIDPVDHNLLSKLQSFANKAHARLVVYDNPGFMETIADLEQYKKSVKGTNYRHDASFFKWQKKRLGVLVNERSTDHENRNAFDSEYVVPNMPKVNNIAVVKDAINYVNAHFPNNFGSTSKFVFPVTHDASVRWLRKFVRERLSTFGKYQDAVSKDVPFGSHSMLSPMLNVGLLTAKQVVDEVLTSGSDSVEAFLRQVIGWRSFARFMYHFHSNDMVAGNLFGHVNNLSDKWYSAGIGLEPIDFMIRKAWKYGYLHHIERLMFMGNAFLLMRVHPTEVYKWFMVCFVDSYEWVMLPNVMGMSQYSMDRAKMMTRPYFSSSRYLLKMSDFQRGEWCDIWDALYYDFIREHKGILRKTYSAASAVGVYEKKTIDEKKKIREIVERFTSYFVSR